MKKGYSLIEVLVASTIFSMVLLGALTSLSSITKFTDQNERDRKVSVAGFEMTDAVARIARYSTAVKDDSGDYICQDLTNPLSLTAREGIYENSNPALGNSSVYLNIKVQSQPDVYRIHHFQITGNLVDKFNLTESVYEATNLNGSLSNCGFTLVNTKTYDFGANIKILWDQTEANKPFSLSVFNSSQTGSAGDLTLNPSLIDETKPKIMQIKISVGQMVDGNIALQKTYQTSISPRFYNQSLSL